MSKSLNNFMTCIHFFNMTIKCSNFFLLSCKDIFVSVLQL